MLIGLRSGHYQIPFANQTRNFIKPRVRPLIVIGQQATWLSEANLRLAETDTGAPAYAIGSMAVKAFPK